MKIGFKNMEAIFLILVMLCKTVRNDGSGLDLESAEAEDWSAIEGWQGLPQENISTSQIELRSTLNPIPSIIKKYAQKVIRQMSMMHPLLAPIVCKKYAFRRMIGYFFKKISISADQNGNNIVGLWLYKIVNNEKFTLKLSTTYL